MVNGCLFTGQIICLMLHIVEFQGDMGQHDHVAGDPVLNRVDLVRLLVKLVAVGSVLDV